MPKSGSRHSSDRKPPLPIYLGCSSSIQVLSRSRKLISLLHRLGISISYARVLELEDWIANAACDQYNEDGAVTSSCFGKGLITVSALENLDHNLSSTTSVSSFQGTGISLMQMPTANVTTIKNVKSSTNQVCTKYF